MKILFLHGWHSVPGGVKPNFLRDKRHEVINPALNDDDFEAALATAQAEFDRHHPQLVVGSSRGGAVAMNIKTGSARLVLLCPAWKNWGSAKVVKPGTIILHSRADDVIPYADSEELIAQSGLPADTLVEVGSDHRLADPEPLAAMLNACEDFNSAIVIPTFGTRQPNVEYLNRQAVYGVCIRDNSVAVVRGECGRVWLPGGGCVLGESEIENLAREVREEIAHSMNVIDRIGQATQYFFSGDENCHFRMRADFFRIELTGPLSVSAEYEIEWLKLDQTASAFFHDSHRWAVWRAATL